MTKRSSARTLWLVLPVLLSTAACAARPELPPLEAVTVTTRAAERPQLILPRPPAVQPVQGIEPAAVTPEVTRLWNDEVGEGTRLPYAYVCFDTQDRLSYQAWTDSLLAHIQALNAILEVYERERQGE